MVVDSSAFVAFVLHEDERPVFEELILGSSRASMSVVSIVESAIALLNRIEGFNPSEVDEIVAGLGIDVQPVDLEQGQVARAAFARYGRDRHAAKLNFGDCFAYALAKVRHDELLFKGDDFAKTDIAAAWRSTTLRLSGGGIDGGLPC